MMQGRFLITALLALSACAPTPYTTPQVSMPAQFPHDTGAADARAVGQTYWTDFSDPVLNVLISEVLASNYNLASAALRVQQAQLQAGLTKRDQLPRASGGMGASTGENTTYSANLSLSYEADLWGRLAAQTRAANWEAVATEEDRDVARLLLIGTTCELYWRIAFTHQQITVGEANLAYARKVRALVDIQHRAGAVSGVEVSEAEQSVQTQISSLAALQQQLVEYRAALTVLRGGQVWDPAHEPRSLPDTVLPEVRAGLPAELLSRRPDLRAAELRLRATLAEVDISRAALYPSLGLTASGGSSSSELLQIFANPAGALAASLSLPFLDYPRLRLNVRLSQKAYEIAVLDFKQTLLQALADTDNALSNRTQLARQAEAQAARLAAAHRTEALYAARYRAGAVALRVWLDAQQALRQAQLNYDNTRLAQLINQSTLYQALGGGI